MIERTVKSPSAGIRLEKCAFSKSKMTVLASLKNFATGYFNLSKGSNRGMRSQGTALAFRWYRGPSKVGEELSPLPPHQVEEAFSASRYARPNPREARPISNYGQYERFLGRKEHSACRFRPRDNSFVKSQTIHLDPKKNSVSLQAMHFRYTFVIGTKGADRMTSGGFSAVLRRVGSRFSFSLPVLELCGLALLAYAASF